MKLFSEETGFCIATVAYVHVPSLLISDVAIKQDHQLVSCSYLFCELRWPIFVRKACRDSNGLRVSVFHNS
jgi:hypothetical protein